MSKRTRLIASVMLASVMLIGGFVMMGLVLWANAEAQRRHNEGAAQRDAAMRTLDQKLDKLMERCSP